MEVIFFDCSCEYPFDRIRGWYHENKTDCGDTIRGLKRQLHIALVIIIGIAIITIMFNQITDETLLWIAEQVFTEMFYQHR